MYFHFFGCFHVVNIEMVVKVGSNNKLFPVLHKFCTFYWEFWKLN
uniref:U3 small nucleolar RNA-associated protein 18-like protein n=1 Tax=Cherax quadricarinatus TaxID=27406 RepID=G0ZJA3_CHEQU|nr:U3 small nucleolar RNA-associated protein 18-like protein [Cherax quadricarinatus]